MSLHAFQPVEHQQVPSAGFERLTQKMQQPCPFGGRRRPFIASEIAVQFSQEIPGIGFLIETPDEQAGWTCESFTPAKLFEKSCRDGRLAGTS